MCRLGCQAICQLSLSVSVGLCVGQLHLSVSMSFGLSFCGVREEVGHFSVQGQIRSIWSLLSLLSVSELTVAGVCFGSILRSTLAVACLFVRGDSSTSCHWHYYTMYIASELE